MAAWLASESWAQLPPTALRVLYPPVVQVGNESKVDVLGQGPLEEIDQLLFSHPGLSARLLPDQTSPLTGTAQKTYGKFSLSVASDVPPGFYEVWAVGRNGVSSSRVVWAVPRTVLSAPQPDSASETPAKLMLDRIFVQRFTAAKTQHYELELSAGQHIRLIAHDAKLDSRAISQLRVLGPDKKLIAAARSDAINGAQAQFTAAQTGIYHIELRDAVYRGGDEFFYALWVEPIEASPLDPNYTAWHDRQAVVSSLVPPTGQLSAARQLTSLSLARLLSVDVPFIESSNGRAQPLEISAPCIVSGNFSSKLHDQAFDFAAKKGDTFWVDVASQQLGEPADPQVSIYKLADSATNTVEGNSAGAKRAPAANPAKLVEQDDPAAIGSPPLRIARADPSLRFEAPADGRYRIVVRDQFMKDTANVGSRYLLILRRPQGALTVVAAWASPTNNAALARPIGNYLMMGGTSGIRIIVDRVEGLTGPVEVTCENLPAGVTAVPIIIPADKDEGHLILTNSEPAASKFAGPLKISARAISNANIKVEAIGAQLNWEPIPTWNALTHRLTQQLLVGVSDKDTSPISFKIADGATLTTTRGGKLAVPIKLTRRAGGGDKVVLRAQGLPTKATMADVTIEGAASEGSGQIVIAADAPAGEASFWYQVETKVKLRNNPQALERAEAEQAQLEKMQSDSTRADQKEAIAAALKASTELVAKLKELTAEREQAVFLPTHNVRIKIMEAPIEPAAAWKVEVRRGTESDHPLTIERFLAFDDAVAVTLVPDSSSTGIELSSMSFAKGAVQASGHVKVAADAALGERRLNLRLSYKYIDQGFSVDRPLVVVVTE